MKFGLSMLATLGLALFLSGSVRAADEEKGGAGEHKRPGRSLKDAIEKYDTNHDGKLDKAELAAIKNTKLLEHLIKLDTNSDGVLDEAEIKAGLESAAKHTHKKAEGDEKGGEKGGEKGDKEKGEKAEKK